MWLLLSHKALGGGRDLALIIRSRDTTPLRTPNSPLYLDMVYTSMVYISLDHCNADLLLRHTDTAFTLCFGHGNQKRRKATNFLGGGGTSVYVGLLQLADTNARN